MDSAGINALVGAYHRKAPNGELRVVGMRANIRRVFEITGLLALFQDDPVQDDPVQDDPVPDDPVQRDPADGRPPLSGQS
jgi:anti-anti-sigma regulatory factor